jgi:peptidoglycan/LPS O-acetylase OafA/YrhL
MKNRLEREGRLENNFGALRLLFAILVILSHSFELIDGDRSREIATTVFHTLSFGELGVYGFFLVSGYLVTKSFEKSCSVGEYVFKRILRIYPGYVVAFVLCVMAIGPFVGGRLTVSSSITVLLRIALLQPPEMQGVFAGMPYPSLNGSMWTIAYEFRCYLLVILLGVTGLLSKRIVLAILTAGALALSALHVQISDWLSFWQLAALIGVPSTTLRFTAIFGCGALFYLYRDRIQYNGRSAILAGSGLIILMFSRHCAEVAVPILGGYTLFWFAFNVRSPTLAGIGHEVDLSYGVYLYAWPVQNLLIWLNPGISPWLVFIATMAIVGPLAFGSWWLVEKPFLSLKAAFVPMALASGRKAL